jgi:CRISPR system Cascade subunit CasD
MQNMQNVRKFLVFQLYGPLASWGEVAVGGERPVAPHPGRSAILGMLAAAAGIRRDQEEQHQVLEQAFGMAVRMETAGTLLHDYHTVQVPPQAALKKHPAITRRDELSALAAYQQDNPKTSGTILSNRAYRCDALYQIALWKRQDSSLTLEQAKDYLNCPNFTLCLGRKSCPPALPLQAHIVKAATLVDAFLAAECISLQEFLEILGMKGVDLNKGRCAALFWDGDSVESGIPARETFIRRDAVLSRRRWQFEERREHHAPWPQQPQQLQQPQTLQQPQQEET